MNRIRVKSNTRYDIEVNDKGEFISFDLNDPSLPFRFNEAFNKTRKRLEEMQKEIAKIESRQDRTSNKYIFSKNEAEKAKVTKSGYEDMREIMDVFLGTGACQKIFGDDNWYSMFNDLMDALEPEFEKMGVSHKATAQRIEQKYKDNDGTVL